MKQLLIIDGHADKFRSAIIAMERIYSVYTYKTKEEGFWFLENNTPDLICVEIDVLGKKDFELLNRLVNSPATVGVPIIAFLSRNSAVSELRAMKLGAADVIAKPFETSIVMARISTQIELADYRKNSEKIIKEKTKSIEKLLDVMSRSFAELVEARDETTGGHIKNTTDYFKILVKYMKKHEEYTEVLTPRYVKNLYRAAPLHDIGKIAIDDSILRKNSFLDDDEIEYMKQHSQIGAKTFDNILLELKSSGLDKEPELDFIKLAWEMSLYHHEKWSGTGGYPVGLKGEEIPLSARILAVVDVYDALTSKRTYKEAFSHERAVSMINEGKDDKFDPKIVEIFNEAAPEIKALLIKRMLVGKLGAQL